MLKMICDRCGKEITNNVCSDRLKGRVTLGKDKILCYEVMVGINCLNDGQLCKDCLMAVLDKAGK